MTEVAYFTMLPDETPEQCVDRHLAVHVANMRKKAVDFITSCRGEGNVKTSDLALIDGALERVRPGVREFMLAQIEADGAQKH